MTTRKAPRSQAEPTAASSDALTADELRELDAEPLPSREVMSTLMWAPEPHVIPLDPPVDAVDTERV